ncbi:hypothetical protein BaRGS_00018366 [Batillaria attramentaria]|uniref:Uncharacterized protein n=1 Tax=Batillaria attramentaria TaxID=370345 RepID=A0ABD0KT90_9CAEN
MVQIIKLWEYRKWNTSQLLVKQTKRVQIKAAEADPDMAKCRGQRPGSTWEAKTMKCGMYRRNCWLRRRR